MSDAMTTEAAIADGSPEFATKALDGLVAKFRGPPPSAAPTDAAGAQSRLNALVADPSFAKSYWDGNVASRREVSELTQQIANGNATQDALAGAKPSETFEFETTFGGEMNSRSRADAIAGLRSLGMDDSTVLQAIDGAAVSPQELAQANMMKAVRMSDEAWISRYMQGGLLEKREMAHLNLIISGASA